MLVLGLNQLFVFHVLCNQWFYQCLSYFPCPESASQNAVSHLHKCITSVCLLGQG